MTDLEKSLNQSTRLIVEVEKLKQIAQMICSKQDDHESRLRAMEWRIIKAAGAVTVLTPFLAVILNKVAEKLIGG